MYDQEASARTRAPAETQPLQTYPNGGTSDSTVRRGAEAAGSAASDVAHTAKQESRQVAGEMKHQARRLAGDMRQRVSERANTHQNRAADGLRQAAQEMRGMAGDRTAASPAGSVVHHLADRSDQLATYLGDRRPEDL